MNSLITASQEVMMSSLQLLDQVNAFRALNGENKILNTDFLKKVKDELDMDDATYDKNIGQELNARGSYSSFLMLTQRECLLIGMRESKKVRRNILSWIESLNKPKTIAPALPDFTNPAVAAIAWAEQYQAKQQAEQLLIEQKPAVEFVQKYVEADNLKGFREVCKLLNANEREFRQFLVDNGIVYRLGGAWTAYKPHIEAGRLATKAATANGKAFNQIMFTAKGVTWIAEKWGRFNGVER